MLLSIAEGSIEGSQTKLQKNIAIKYRLLSNHHMQLGLVCY